MKKTIIKILSILIFFIAFPTVFGSVSAASLKFDKTTVSVENGGTFSVAVTVDPGSDGLSSTDVYVTYDPSFLTATTVAAGTLFPTVSHDESTSGRVYIAGMVNDPATSITTEGTLATITFQALKSGTTSLAFDCNTSKIIKNDINASDVMICVQNNSSTVTISGGTNNQNNSQDNSSNNSGTTSNSSPTQELPQSGIFDNVSRIAVPGILLLFLGSILRIVL